MSMRTDAANNIILIKCFIVLASPYA